MGMMIRVVIAHVTVKKIGGAFVSGVRLSAINILALSILLLSSLLLLYLTLSLSKSLDFSSPYWKERRMCRAIGVRIRESVGVVSQEY